MTERSSDDRINLALIEVRNTERYRSGHNEAVLKTVCPQGRVGSNPTLSAICLSSHDGEHILCQSAFDALGEVPKLAEGTPLERVQVVNSGARVQIPPSPLVHQMMNEIK